jgi:hypothetical protein
MGVVRLGCGWRGPATATQGVAAVINTDVLMSGGSEDGGSEPKLCFSGVRKGDLKGLWSVLVASLSRRRFASGVDMLAVVCALSVSDKQNVILSLTRVTRSGVKLSSRK